MDLTKYDDFCKIDLTVLVNQLFRETRGLGVLQKPDKIF